MLRVREPKPRVHTHRSLFAAIGRFLEEHELFPSPENYSLAFQLIRDGDSPVAREVRKITADGLRLTQPEVDRIRIEFGMRSVQIDSPEVDEGAVVAARMLMDQFATTVEQARAEAQSYGRDLEEGAAALRREDESPVIGRLVQITGAILARTRAAERRLAAAESEAQTLREQLVQVEEEARTDPLTDLPNRRALEDRLAELEQRGAEVSLAICDVDRFKEINDSRGHGVGDRVLRMIAGRLREACPKQMVARFGGDEFVILFEGLAPAAAAAMLEEARASVAGRQFRLRENEEPVGAVSFSAGIAGSAPEGGLMKRADAALYEAKTAGRDRICCERQETAAALVSKQG